jgi:hypothetical protein
MALLVGKTFPYEPSMAAVLGQTTARLHPPLSGGRCLLESTSGS